MRNKKSDKYKIIEGRGQGRLESYEPYLKVHEFGSTGRAHRVRGWKINRVYQLMSDLEFYFFLIMQWQSEIIDIREQYPLLPLDETIEIADSLSIRHPAIKNKRGEEVVMTTDFVLTKFQNNAQVDFVRTIKPYKTLNNKRVIEKFMIEKEYFGRRDIDWGVVTDEQIPRVFALNINYLYDGYFWNETRGFTPQAVDRLVYNFKDILIRYNMDLLKTSTEFERINGLNMGEGINFLKFLLTRKEIFTDMNQKINLFTMKVWL
jgi:hypothetical protein